MKELNFFSYLFINKRVIVTKCEKYISCARLFNITRLNSSECGGVLLLADKSGSSSASESPWAVEDTGEDWFDNGVLRPSGYTGTGLGAPECLAMCSFRREKLENACGNQFVEIGGSFSLRLSVRCTLYGDH